MNKKSLKKDSLEFDKKKKETIVSNKKEKNKDNKEIDLEKDSCVIDNDDIGSLKDEVQENVENISIAMIILVILICFVVGTILGYMLYRIAINNSNDLSFILNNYFNI